MIRTPIYRDYMLVVLLVIMAFNNVDRLALGLLLQYIKVDLSLSDTQLGLLTGIAFALFYSLMGIPIARWADRGNRITIITITTTLWSTAVALCGLAGNFLQLLLIRIGVAVGEAGCVPPAHSLIADYFNREERPRAVAVYKLGVPLSLLIGYFLAGWLNQLYGWRMAFIILGLPGPFLAALAWFTLREPRREKSHDCAERSPASESQAPSLKEVCRTLFTNATFRHLLFSYSLSTFFASGISQWTPAFFVRSFGLTSGELGTWFALVYAVTGFIGVYGGGVLASRYAAGNERLQLRVMSLLYCGYVAISIFKYLAPNKYLAFGAMGLAYVGVSAMIAPLFAMMQTLVPSRMRAMAIAVVFLCANLVGYGLGPLVTGILSDALQPTFGEESLRYALLALCPGYFWCAWHLWRASRTALRDLA